ncbi:hypothetical protein BpHYR1_011597 [Brachionus plicatilis]|uniref:Uncharacterized protein n=1 Tax=Brachionus plicatilis TaxID=10195 RepID=A0A3M7S2K4_BRAPC|nr:hypothetical protein BpHYR1_011597 [Brachionus plicatilis]
MIKKWIITQYEKTFVINVFYLIPSFDYAAPFKNSIFSDIVDLKIEINLSPFKCLTLGNIDSSFSQILPTPPIFKFCYEKIDEKITIFKPIIFFYYLNSNKIHFFTKNEQKTGLSLRLNQQPKEQLDSFQVQILKEAFMCKFQIPDNKIEDTWYSAGKIANRRCYDAIQIRQNEKSNEKIDQKLLRFSRKSSYIFSNEVSHESKIFLNNYYLARLLFILLLFDLVPSSDCRPISVASSLSAII